MKNDSAYEKARQDVYMPLVERVHSDRQQDIFIYSLSCGIGWRKIVYKLVKELDKIWGKENWTILQMKEKFGGLRFYIDHPEDPVRMEKSQKAIERAATAAWKTCERCGKPGRTVGTGYIATVCKPCEKRWKERTAQGLWPTLFG